MYRLTLYYLLALVGIAIVLSFLGFLSYNPYDIAIDAIAALLVSWLSNKFIAQFFHAVTNSESALITGLILMLIIPIKFPYNFTFLVAACVLAMASKYIAIIDKQHIFNPAAVSVLAFALLTDHSATWWVGTPAMLPFVVIGGLLLARKIQRGRMLTVFFLTYFFITAMFAFLHSGMTGIVTIWKAGILDSALFFFGFVMLTEPLTSPSTARLRHYYAAIVAFLFATPSLRIPGIVLLPEMALCTGNVFSYFATPKYRLVLPLTSKKFYANTGVFAFALPSHIRFMPGQYMEWTLPHNSTDSRGNRRYFSIASSPTEKELLLTVKFYNPSSSYKKKLQELQPGDTVIAASLEGDFILPKNLKTPLVFLAGGVGIAPFRSMIQYIIDKKMQVDIVVMYANRTANEIVFQNELEKAKDFGVKTVYTLTDTAHIPIHWHGKKGYITKEMIQEEIPNFAKRIYYLSGPQVMVDSYKDMLSGMGIPGRHIRQDFFPGYNE